MGKINIDLGGLFGAMGLGQPVANPAYGAMLDEDGNWVTKDASGASTPIDPNLAASLQNNPNIARKPYSDPSFWMRATNPALASQVSLANIQGQEAPSSAQMASDIQTGVGANKFGKVQKSLSTPVTSLTPEQGAILSANNPDADTLYRMGQHAANNEWGIPEQSAKVEGQTLDSTSQRLARASMLGTPSILGTSDYANANADLSGGINRNLSNVVNRPNIPLEAQNTSLGLTRDIGMNQGAIARQPYINDAAKTQAMIDNALTQLKGNNIDTLLNTEQSGIRNEARQAAYPATLPNPTYVKADGTIARNPMYTDLMTAMQAKLPPAGGNVARPVPLGNGLNIVPSSATTNQVARPAINGNTQIVRPIRTQPITNNIPGSISSNDTVTETPFETVGNLIKSQFPSQSPYPPKYWENLIKEDTTGKNTEYYKSKLQESKDYYAAHPK